MSATEAALNPETIVNQVRQNIANNLILDAKSNPQSRQLLFDMLSREDMTISDDLLRKALDASNGKIGFVKSVRPFIDTYNPKPNLTSWRPHDLKVWIKLWVRYLSLKFLIMFLPRVLKFQTETRAFIVTNPCDVLDPHSASTEAIQ